MLDIVHCISTGLQSNFEDEFLVFLLVRGLGYVGKS